MDGRGDYADLVVPMELVGVRLEVPANAPVVLLREQADRHRLLPIYIGGPEATAIHSFLEGVKPERPLTHDLFRSVLETIGAELQHIVITEIREHTFYAELVMQVGDEVKRVSSRPSDAIALAIRTGAGIFAEETLLDEAAKDPEPEEPTSTEEIIDEFRDFIDQVSPEDFADD
jgi:bifunctional DNase/RNase